MIELRQTLPNFLTSLPFLWDNSFVLSLHLASCEAFSVSLRATRLSRPGHALSFRSRPGLPPANPHQSNSDRSLNQCLSAALVPKARSSLPRRLLAPPCPRWPRRLATRTAHPSAVSPLPMAASAALPALPATPISALFTPANSLALNPPMTSPAKSPSTSPANISPPMTLPLPSRASSPPSFAAISAQKSPELSPTTRKSSLNSSASANTSTSAPLAPNPGAAPSATPSATISPSATPLHQLPR